MTGVLAGVVGVIWNGGARYLEEKEDEVVLRRGESSSMPQTLPQLRHQNSQANERADETQAAGGCTGQGWRTRMDGARHGRLVVGGGLKRSKARLMLSWMRDGRWTFGGTTAEVQVLSGGTWACDAWPGRLHRTGVRDLDPLHPCTARIRLPAAGEVATDIRVRSCLPTQPWERIVPPGHEAEETRPPALAWTQAASCNDFPQPRSRLSVARMAPIRG